MAMAKQRIIPQVAVCEVCESEYGPEEQDLPTIIQPYKKTGPERLIIKIGVCQGCDGIEAPD